VDHARLLHADKAYAAGDWRGAAREYLAAVHGSQPEGTGHAYHMAGNSLVRLRRNGDAATVYGHALKDPEYGKRGAVLANLGAALAADARYSEAVESFRSALAEPGYDAPWKAQQGLAGALFDMGRYEEACAEYREAAWSKGNPDPGRALNNLGLCFMKLGRTEEAVEPYRTAIATDSYQAKGRASANLGLAYVAMGFSEEAVRAFETARDVHGHELTGPALAAYKAAKAAVGPEPEQDAGSAPATEPAAQIAAAPAVESAPAAETVEGWSTGEMPPALGDTADAATSPVATPATGVAGTAPRSTVGTGENAFFTRTEDEAREVGREAERVERRERLTGRVLAVRIGVAVAVSLLAVGGLAAAWFMGVGYPSQVATVSGMLDAYKAGTEVGTFWVAVPLTDVKQEMRKLPARFESFTLASTKATSLASTVRVTVVLQKDASLRYDVSLVREGVGWKVNGISNAWTSTGEGP
jgi:tetratricopeptide (TPR) repeat protein